VFGGTVYTHDTLGPSYRIHHTNDCDTLVTLDLHVIPYISTLLEPDTFCYRDPYHWRGQTAGEGHDTITRPAHSTLVDTLTSASGCDSLVVLPLVQMPPPPLTFHYEPDCQSNTYTLHAVTDLGCDEKLFKRIVKATFNQRRKMLRVSLRQICNPRSEFFDDPMMTRRPEQLSISEFIALTNKVATELT
jgi:hypothetical protein